MSVAAITPQVHETFDVHGDFPSKITFYGIVTNLTADLFYLRFCQILHFRGRIDLSRLANFPRS